MSALSTFCAWWSPRLLSVLRIVAAFLFMAHGTMKLFSFPAARSAGPADWLSLIGVAGILEAFGGDTLAELRGRVASRRRSLECGGGGRSGDSGTE